MNRGNNDNAIDKRDTYTFVFNSKNGNKTAQGGQEVVYSIDWSIMPDQPYDVTFTYVGQVNNLDYTKLPQVFIDFGGSALTYVAGNARQNTYGSQYLGILKSYMVGTSSFLHAEVGTNTPITILGRPFNNIPIIRIFDNANPMVLFSPATGILNDYILTLHFTPTTAR